MRRTIIHDFFKIYYHALKFISIIVSDGRDPNSTLSSVDPRPNIFPSISVSTKGSVFQPS